MARVIKAGSNVTQTCKCVCYLLYQVAYATIWGKPFRLHPISKKVHNFKPLAFHWGKGVVDSFP